MHSLLRHTRPSPHSSPSSASSQTPGVIGPSSIRHSAEHPSPLTAFPSSHSSASSTTPLPQRASPSTTSSPHAVRNTNVDRSTKPLHLKNVLIMKSPPTPREGVKPAYTLTKASDNLERPKL